MSEHYPEHNQAHEQQVDGWQLMRRVTAAGMAVGSFAIVVAQPANASTAEASPSGELGLGKAIEWTAPNQMAVPIGAPIPKVNKLSAETIAIKNTTNLKEANSNAFGAIEVLIAPTNKPVDTMITKPLRQPPAPKSTIAISKGQLRLWDDHRPLPLVSPAQLKNISPYIKSNPVANAPTVASAPAPQAQLPPKPVRLPADQMHISDAGIDLVTQYEGWRTNLYNDATGNATIGYGHLVHMGPIDGTEPTEFKQGITPDRGREILRNDLASAEKAVDQAVNVPITQPQEDALDSLAFNIGGGAFKSSTLVKRLNNGEYEAVADEIMRWNMGDGRELPGLTRRRTQEAALWAQSVLAAGSKAVTSLTPDIDNLLIGVEVALKDPFSDSSLPAVKLAPPRVVGSLNDLMRPPKWKDSKPGAQAETAPKSYLRQPFKGPAVITSPFGNRESPTEGASSCHLGIDFALDTNAAVLAPRDGEVVANGSLAAQGNLLVIRHEGILTLYFHLNEQSELPVGSKVVTGQVIARVGSTGYSTGPHLHLGVIAGFDPSRPVSLNDGVNGKYVDPTGFLEGYDTPSTPISNLKTANVCK